jgi:ribulose-phosphate 3-epimerase
MSERMTELLGERRVAPSILSADFSRLGSQVEEVMAAGARVIHVDVMDGHFVPPITIGPLVAASIADRVHAAGGAIDVHLMIEAPERHIEAFAAAGADSITFHAEATPHANRTLAAIRELGCLAGIAINPGTPVEALTELRGRADIALCMTVNPGWGGQSFIDGSNDKVSRLATVLGDVEIEVDGGIDVGTAGPIAAAGHPCSSQDRRCSAPPILPRPMLRSSPQPALPEAYPTSESDIDHEEAEERLEGRRGGRLSLSADRRENRGAGRLAGRDARPGPGSRQAGRPRSGRGVEMERGSCLVPRRDDLHR